MLGAELGIRGVFAIDHLNHHTELPKRVLRATEPLDDAAIAQIAGRLHRAAWGFLPPRLRTYALKWQGRTAFSSADLDALLGGAAPSQRAVRCDDAFNRS